MPQKKKKDKRRAPSPKKGKLSLREIKKIAGGDRDSEHFLPFCATCTDPCCNGYILATESEHKRIVEFSGKDHFEKERNYYVHEGDPCRYLVNGLCSIHSVRPTICQIFPYHIDGDTGKLANDSSCPALETLPASFKRKVKRKVKKLLDEMGWKSFLHFWLS